MSNPNDPPAPPPPNVPDPTTVIPPPHTTAKNGGSYIKGKRKVIKGDPKHKHHGKRIDAELYEAIWESWRDGTRNKSRLSAMFSLSFQTISRLVEDGYPERGFPSFIERLRVWEAAAATAKTSTIEDKKKKESEEWEANKAHMLKLSHATKIGLGNLIMKANVATQRAEFIKNRKRKVLDKHGDVHVIDEDVPASALEMADAWRTIVNSVEAVGRIESFWRGGPTSRAEIMGTAASALAAFQKLTPEQLDYIITSGGAMPPGVSAEDLFGTVTTTSSDDPKN
jgi:hypothetical protein